MNAGPPRISKRLAALVAPLAVFGSLVAILGATGSEQPASGSTGSAELKARAAKQLARVQSGGGLGLYARAADGYSRALERSPGDVEAATGLAAATLGQHRFRRGLRLAQAAQGLEPASVGPLPTVIDGLVEAGRYPAAARASDRLARLKPGVAAYSRIAYLRELQGDLAGAVRALRLARGAAAANPPAIAFASALLGELEMDRGRYGRAKAEFRAALVAVPGFRAAREGLAHLLAARGRYGAAIRAYRALTRDGRADPPASLAAIEAHVGLDGAAERHVELARRRFAAELDAGMRVDAGAVRFVADYGSPRRAVALGRGVWRRAPSVTSADAYAWALSAAGRHRAALRLSREALATGWSDPEALFRAGAVSFEAGADRRAEELLSTALRRSPRFHGVDAPRAREMLAALRG